MQYIKLVASRMVKVTLKLALKLAHPRQPAAMKIQPTQEVRRLAGMKAHVETVGMNPRPQR